jgi:hypothetical protein
MDDELIELERELKQLRPRGISPELMARIGRELRVEPLGARDVATFTRRAGSFGDVLCRISLWPVAAVFVFGVAWLVVVGGRSGVARESASRGVHVAGVPASSRALLVASDVIYDSVDEGIFVVDDAPPVRLVRNRHVSAVSWTDPQSRATFECTLPREELVSLPVRLN